MTDEEYIEIRVKNQIDWYNSKSKKNKNWYYTLRIIEIIAAASIPFLTNFIGSGSVIKLIIGILGIIITIIASIIGIFHFHEKWIEYRSTCESLKHTNYLFQTKTSPYNGEEPFSLFVEQIEHQVSKENSKWNQYACSEKTRRV